ncbi:hypothetical protein MNEG_16579, partial [Monoraphidium neglectum]
MAPRQRAAPGPTWGSASLSPSLSPSASIMSLSMAMVCGVSGGTDGRLLGTKGSGAAE